MRQHCPWAIAIVSQLISREAAKLRSMSAIRRYGWFRDPVRAPIQGYKFTQHRPSFLQQLRLLPIATTRNRPLHFSKLLYSVDMSSSMQQSAEQLAALCETLLVHIRDAFNDLPADLDINNPATRPAVRMWARYFSRNFVSRPL
jgi:hypothetical protein